MPPLQRATRMDLVCSIEPDGKATDPYKLLASKMFGVAYEEVSEEQRSQAKSALFRGFYQR